MSVSSVRNRSTPADATALRPRNKRLISGLLNGDDEVVILNTTSTPLGRVESPAQGQLSSRSASPIPPAHPQRSHREPALQGHSKDRRAKQDGHRGERGLDKDSQTFANIWGHSWNALQGIASDLLGGESVAVDAERRSNARRTTRQSHGQSQAINEISTFWGPTGQKSVLHSHDIGAGTREEQTAAFRASKKKDMLMGEHSSYTDALGKFKRRLSDDRASSSAPPPEHEERDALVYIHPVQKDDTLAGIMIRYRIAANVLRQANGMWPNDTVQARQTLILPVDACGIKGRPNAGPDDEVDLLVSENEALNSLHAEEVLAVKPFAADATALGLVSGRHRDSSFSTNTTSSHTASGVIGEQPQWSHESWVILPGNLNPIRVARLPRRALGYFPRARRTSRTLSDLDTTVTSLELHRGEASDGSPAKKLPARSLDRTRESNAMNGYYTDYLSGPGGVGTMSSNVRRPGPAQDGLNRIFAKHLPDVAPPRRFDLEVDPVTTPYTDNPFLPTSGSVTPAHLRSTRAGRGTLNLENVGSAIESWVRRLGTKPQTSLADRQQAAKVSVGTPIKGAGGIGDLIEMTDELDLNAGVEDAHERRGRSDGVLSSGAYEHAAASKMVTTGYFDGLQVTRRVHDLGHGKDTKED